MCNKSRLTKGKTYGLVQDVADGASRGGRSVRIFTHHRRRVVFPRGYGYSDDVGAGLDLGGLAGPRRRLIYLSALPERMEHNGFYITEIVGFSTR